MTDIVKPEGKAARLEQFKSDVLLLIDLVSAKSDKAELIAQDDLKNAFIAKAATATAPLKDELVAQMQASPDEYMRQAAHANPNTVPIRPVAKKGEVQENLPPTTRQQRKVLTRRALLKTLIGAEAVATTQPAQAQEPVEAREISEEYFFEVLEESLKDTYGVARLVSWDKVTYYHYKPLLSASYARLLSAQNNPAELVRDTVRENSRIYPRPIAIGCFEDMPFNLKPEEIETVLEVLNNDPDSQDIRFTQTSIGTVFLYSNKYLEDDYADYLAEYIDVGMDESP
ncbi:MAG: hypothetical protein Q4E62_05095 [Sutterellaceae bacterium]|nr:hypothetical protein [Sutterellaceae bacterium]